MGAEVDAICGAAYHQPRAHTSAQTGIAAVLRDTRLCTTRAQRSQSFVRGATSPTGSKSTVVLRKARPDQRDRHLLFVLGVLTRRLEKLTRRPRSRSCRSPRSFEMAHSLRRQDPEPFAPVPQTAGHLPDRLRQMPSWSRCERLVLTGVSAEKGHRESLGTLRSPPPEHKAGWLACWRSLVARGLSGVVLVSLRCPAGARLRDRRDPGHLAALVASTTRAISWPRWPNHEQP